MNLKAEKTGKRRRFSLEGNDVGVFVDADLDAGSVVVVVVYFVILVVANIAVTVIVAEFVFVDATVVSFVVDVVTVAVFVVVVAVAAAVFRFNGRLSSGRSTFSTVTFRRLIGLIKI